MLCTVTQITTHNLILLWIIHQRMLRNSNKKQLSHPWDYVMTFSTRCVSATIRQNITFNKAFNISLGDGAARKNQLAFNELLIDANAKWIAKDYFLNFSHFTPRCMLTFTYIKYAHETVLINFIDVLLLDPSSDWLFGIFSRATSKPWLMFHIWKRTILNK